MNIKKRVVFGFLLTVLVMAGGIVPYVIISMRDNAEESYLSGSSKQLQAMDSYVSAFVREAERNAAYLAGTEVITEGLGLFPNLSNTTAPTEFRHDRLSPAALAVVQPLFRMHKGNEAYEEAYIGYIDGSYVSSIPATKLPAGMNSLKRPWYIQRTSSDKNVGLADSYLSITGELVIAATHKLFDRSGKLIGALGLDVSLNGLSERFKSFNFGNTGYFLLIENTGRILCNPRQQDITGKIIGKDVTDPGLAEILKIKNGTVSIPLHGQTMRANVLTTNFGWKIVALQAESEIFSGSNSAIRSISIISVCITLAVLLLAYFLVNSINRPLRLIVSEADKIAQGDLDVHLDENSFYGELAELRTSLLNMVSNIKKMIKTADQKSREAEENLLMAKNAKEQAEQARLQAEHARHEGISTAAAQLEEVVSTISSAAGKLASRIGRANNISAESARRLREAASAMQQMSTAIRDVAGSASSASSMSAETRANAEGGARIVQSVLQSIGNVQRVSADLKKDMAQLNEHAQAISRIMGVIVDIADQTNLLALNAAIEAARAGDAGRGFAVVADEVRKLAEKTTTSTQDVGNAIKAIQDSMLRSLSGMDNALEQVEKATALADESGAALRQIVANVEVTADQVHSIATASEQQSSSSESINRSIDKVNEMAGETAQTMGEASSAVDELARQSRRLSELIMGMKK